VTDLVDKELKGLRLLEQFRKTLRRVSRRRQPPDSPERAHCQRQREDYLCLFLFGVLNPVIRSMRALCELSQSERVQDRLGCGAFSRSTFSEVQHLVDPALLEEVFEELARAAQKQQPVRPGEVSWRIADSSVFDVLQRMRWAHYQTHHGQPQSAIRLHVSLDMLSALPLQAKVTRARVCERTVWRTHWEAGAGEVGDRNYSQDYRLLRLLEKKPAWFILRLREKQTHVVVSQELPLSAADRAAGVTRQVWGHLGKSDKTRSPRVRVLWLQTATGEPLMLVTNQSPEQMPADLVGLTYRHRWQVELFFRWIKCLLQCRHFLAESPAGVTLQLYLALIGAVLIQLHLGRRPSQRLWEAVQFYFLGVYGPKDLAAALQRDNARVAARKIKKS
jgi:Transposase DDE domain